MYKGKRKLLSNHLKVENLCMEKKINVIDLGIYTVMVINIYIVKKIFKTKVNSPRKIGKGVRQGCILSPCLFNLYAEYIMRNTGLEETQAGIKVAREKYQ